MQLAPRYCPPISTLSDFLWPIHRTSFEDLQAIKQQRPVQLSPRYFPTIFSRFFLWPIHRTSLEDLQAIHGPLNVKVL